METIRKNARMIPITHSSIHKSENVRHDDPCKNQKGHFAKSSAILDMTMISRRFKHIISPNESLLIFWQLWQIFPPSVRPFSLTKRASFQFLDNIAINCQYRTCCGSPKVPFWILFLQRVQNGAGTIPLNHYSASRVKNFSNQILSRRKNSRPIGSKRLINRTVWESKDIIWFQSASLNATILEISFQVTEFDKMQNAPARDDIPIRILVIQEIDPSIPQYQIESAFCRR